MSPFLQLTVDPVTGEARLKNWRKMRESKWNPSTKILSKGKLTASMSISSKRRRLAKEDDDEQVLKRWKDLTKGAVEGTFTKATATLERSFEECCWSRSLCFLSIDDACRFMQVKKGCPGVNCKCKTLCLEKVRKAVTTVNVTHWRHLNTEAGRLFPNTTATNIFIVSPPLGTVPYSMPFEYVWHVGPYLTSFKKLSVTTTSNRRAPDTGIVVTQETLTDAEKRTTCYMLQSIIGCIRTGALPMDFMVKGSVLSARARRCKGHGKMHNCCLCRNIFSTFPIETTCSGRLACWEDTCLSIRDTIRTLRERSYFNAEIRKQLLLSRIAYEFHRSRQEGAMVLIGEEIFDARRLLRHQFHCLRELINTGLDPAKLTKADLYKSLLIELHRDDTKVFDRQTIANLVQLGFPLCEADLILV